MAEKKFLAFKIVVLEILVGRTVPLIRAALADLIENRAAYAILGRECGCVHLNLGHVLKNHLVEIRAMRQHDVGAIRQEVIVIRQVPIDRDASARAGRSRQKLGKIRPTLVHIRQLLHYLSLQGGGLFAAFGLEQRGLCCDPNFGLSRAHREDSVYCSGSHLQVDSAPHELFEARLAKR